MNRILL